jgi:hypothetical protein
VQLHSPRILDDRANVTRLVHKAFNDCGGYRRNAFRTIVTGEVPACGAGLEERT